MELEIFHQFKWLLTKEQEKNLASYVKQILNQSADPKTPCKEASSSSSEAPPAMGSESKTKRKQKEAFDSSRAAIMKFFKTSE